MFLSYSNKVMFSFYSITCDKFNCFCVITNDTSIVFLLFFVLGFCANKIKSTLLKINAQASRDTFTQCDINNTLLVRKTTNTHYFML